MKHRLYSAVLIAALALTLVCAVYVGDYYRADSLAAEAMQPAAGITVAQNGNTVAFIPEQADVGLIFYPGGKVEATAYAPLLRALAERNVLCVLTEMPLRLAVLDANAASDVPQQYPQISRWYIGGHSLGGSMAASHAANHAERYEGLVLLAAYSTSNLRDSGLRVVSAYGSEDGVLNMEKYANALPNLPEGYEEHILEGGCHAGFGCYGPQDGDGEPTLSGDAQIAQTADLLAEFFGRTDAPANQTQGG